MNNLKERGRRSGKKKGICRGDSKEFVFKKGGGKTKKSG